MKRVVVGVGLCIVAVCGLVAFFTTDFTSEAKPTTLERRLASALLTMKLRFIRRSEKPPIESSAADLNRGREIYEQQCSFCHGNPGKPGMLAESFSPRPPQFAVERVQRPTSMNAYIIRHGIRWSAMPAFKNLSQSDAWRVAAYLETLGATKTR